MFKQSIVWLRRYSSSRKGLCLTLLLALSFNLQVAPILAQTMATVTLAPGRPVEREISGGQTQSYQVTAAAGQFVGVTVRQSGVDVGEKLFAPDGKLVAEFNVEVRPQGEERADFVAETAGTYRLDVSPELRGAAGRYEIRITEMHPATEQERALHEMHKLFTQAERLMGAEKFHESLPLLTRAVE